MTTTPELTESPLVDVRDMIVVHTALLREFRLAPAAVSRVEPDAGAAAKAVDTHLALLCDMLHHHHQGEDTLLWPLLTARVNVTGQALVAEAERQHQLLDACLTSVTSARAAWIVDPGRDNRDRLANALEQLHAMLKVHLDHEESAILPLAASTLSQEEWNAIGASAAASMPKPMLLLVFGMFAYEGDPAVLRHMLAAAPAPVRLIVPRLAPRVYARRARSVYGTSRP